jgi:hypothetical protein
VSGNYQIFLNVQKLFQNVMAQFESQQILQYPEHRRFGCRIGHRIYVAALGAE